MEKIAEHVVSFSKDEILDPNKPILQHGKEISLNEFMNSIRPLIHSIVPLGLPPVRMTERLCKEAGIEIQPTLLELAVLAVISEWDPDYVQTKAAAIH